MSQTSIVRKLKTNIGQSWTWNHNSIPTGSNWNTDWAEFDHIYPLTLSDFVRLFFECASHRFTHLHPSAWKQLPAIWRAFHSVANNKLVADSVAEFVEQCRSPLWKNVGHWKMSHTHFSCNVINAIIVENWCKMSNMPNAQGFCRFPLGVFFLGSDRMKGLVALLDFCLGFSNLVTAWHDASWCYSRGIGSHDSTNLHASKMHPHIPCPPSNFQRFVCEVNLNL